ncbi:SDR family oxidoreductase, partial [Candidatus Hydrogenedentota bacterium]
IPGVYMLKTDLTDLGAIDMLFYELFPDAVIHLGCMSKPADVLAQPERSREINVDASLRIAELCAEGDIPMVFTSTGLVFDGVKGNYTEDSPQEPPNLYGEQKAEAEKGIMERHPEAVICRLSWTYGPPTKGNQSFIQPMLEAVRAGRVLEEFVDIFASPSSVRAVMNGFFLAMEKGSGTFHLGEVKGPGIFHLGEVKDSAIFHLGGVKRMSRFEFARELLAAYELPEEAVKPRCLKDATDGVKRARDTSLISAKAVALGYDPLPHSEELRLIREYESTS